LIEQWLDQTISEQDLTLLKAELLSNRSALECYVNMAEMHSMLEQSQASAQPLQPSNVVPMERILRRQKRRISRVALAAAAAVLVLGLITMRLFFIDPTEHSPTLVFETAPGTQFTLTHNGDDDAPKGRVLANGSRLQLSQGTVELTFSSGVKSIIIAPADLTLHDDDKLYLNQGTAWFHVPTQAVGFNVITKDLDIVDLGTEFGVFAKLKNHDEVHVIQGRVQVTANHVRKESIQLTAGQARRVDPIGRLAVIEVKPDAFLTTLPKSLPYFHWSFDQEDGFQVVGTHPASVDLITHPHADPQFTEGKRGSALALNGTGQYLETDWEGFSGNRPRTVSFWLKIPEEGNYRDHPGIVGWGNRTLHNTMWKITLDNRGGDNSAYIRLSWGGRWITAREPVSPNQWQHVTITSGGKLNANGLPQAEIYINGNMVKTIPGGQTLVDFQKPQTSTVTLNAVPLIIGGDLYPTPKKRHTFHGEIDELTIFDGHMTAEEVKHHFRP